MKTPSLVYFAVLLILVVVTPVQAFEPVCGKNQVQVECAPCNTTCGHSGPTACPQYCIANPLPYQNCVCKSGYCVTPGPNGRCVKAG